MVECRTVFDDVYRAVGITYPPTGRMSRPRYASVAGADAAVVGADVEEAR